MEENTQQSTPSAPEKQSFLKNKWLLLGLGIIILISLIGMAYYLGKKSSDKITVTPSPSPTVQENTIKEATKNLQYILYKHTQAPTGDVAYQTEIPSNWSAYTIETGDINTRVSETKLGPSHFSQNNDSSETNDMSAQITIKVSNKQPLISTVPENSKSITVDGVEAKQFTTPDQRGVSLNILFSKGKTNYLILEPNGSGEGSDILKHLLSTFKIEKGILF